MFSIEFNILFNFKDVSNLKVSKIHEHLPKVISYFEVTWSFNTLVFYFLEMLLHETKRILFGCTFSVQLQHPQQAHGFEHLCYEHLQAALQLDEEPTDLRVDFSVFWSAG